MSKSLISLPLPEDEVLAMWASVMNEEGHWAYVLDASWRFAYATDDVRLSWGDTGAATALPVGSHFYGAEATQFLRATIGNHMFNDGDFRRARFLDWGRYVLASTPGGRDALRRDVDPYLADLVDELEPTEMPSILPGKIGATFAGVEVEGSAMTFRINNADGRLAGICILMKPRAGMSQLAAASYVADVTHLERMQLVERPDRRPAAILMADLESSTPLARRLSTAKYFAFGRRLVRAFDQCVIDSGGIVGRHTGDGVVGFFLVETAGSESTAATACITAAKCLRSKIVEIAERSEVPAKDLALRFGLHWGSALYMGRIMTGGRSEVTALGDEMNEAARIEACASGGKLLASKSLIERLSQTDAQNLGLDPAQTNYTLLGDLETATDKARRDAATIPVCDLADSLRALT
jgi:class 3 adenylate cyclase